MSSMMNPSKMNFSQQTNPHPPFSFLVTAAAMSCATLSFEGARAFLVFFAGAETADAEACWCSVWAIFFFSRELWTPDGFFLSKIDPVCGFAGSNVASASRNCSSLGLNCRWAVRFEQLLHASKKAFNWTTTSFSSCALLKERCRLHKVLVFDFKGFCGQHGSRGK